VRRQLGRIVEHEGEHVRNIERVMAAAPRT
jgi:hypothetical protein